MTTDLNCAKWTGLYKVINQANLCIKYLPGVDMPSVSDRNDLLGQAYGCAALAYLYAVRVWGDVPLFTEPNEEYSPDIYRERTDKEYILREVILEDAKKAESLLDRTKNKERKPQSRLTARGRSWPTPTCGSRSTASPTRPSRR